MDTRWVQLLCRRARCTHNSHGVAEMGLKCLLDLEIAKRVRKNNLLFKSVVDKSRQFTFCLSLFSRVLQRTSVGVFLHVETRILLNSITLSVLQRNRFA